MVVPTGGEAGDGPAVLRLQKWDQSQFQLDPSDFHEAFISPTRGVLVLLSYHNEALFLPLIAGNLSSFLSMNRGDFDGCCSEDCETPSTSLHSSTSFTASSRSDLLSSVPHSPKHVKVEHEHKIISSTSKQYPVICGVNSLAWGHCGDAYKQHSGAVFKELLLVSGDHGVTVHAFCCLDKNDEVTKLPAPDGGVGQGKWVEWWPPSVTAHEPNAQKLSSFYSESSEYINRSNGTQESPPDAHEVDGCDDSSGRSCMLKRWLWTYLTEVKTLE